MCITNIFEYTKLKKRLIIKQNLHATDYKQYKINFNSLKTILIIGFRVRDKRILRFCKWAYKNLHNDLQKYFLINNDKLKKLKHTNYFSKILNKLEIQS